jgi:nicotinamide-nucleotide amidase
VQAKPLSDLAQTIIDKASAKGVIVAAAESCTGGMITAALTDVPGSSAVVDRGFVTYTNEAKHEMLGVPMELIDAHGAVSEDVASAMAAGALRHSRAEIAVSVTGIAGPTGGSAEKPVGLVWFGLARRSGGVQTEKHIFADKSRDFVRTEAAQKALQLILGALN